MLRNLFTVHRVRRQTERLERRDLLSGVMQFSVSSYFVGENGGDALITVTRSGTLTTASNVSWSTSNGTAQAGSDYQAASGVLSFAANETSKTFTVRTILDGDAEANETLNLALSNPTGGGSLGTRSTATLTILDASVGFSETRLTDQLNSPVTMAIAPDGRIFVAEQAGKVRVIKNGVLLANPALTVNTVADDEEGLVGLAFDPNFASNGYLYATYTRSTPTRHNVISRFTVSGDTVVPGSELKLFDLSDNVAHYHIGGAIHFGADGKLYTTTGDNANSNNSGSLSTLHGKLLRLNPDGTIPTDNPFYNSVSGNLRAIWALGLRNGFTFDVQPGTGRIFISDVGGDFWEEVNEGVAGANYGWPVAEGPLGNTPPISFGTYQNPLHAYDHNHGYAITGAAFYNPATAAFGEGYTGQFFFTEYVLNEIRWIDPNNPNTYTVFRPTSSAGPVDVRVGPDGSLYYLSRGNSDFGGGPDVPGGSVFKISYTGSAAPSISVPPADRTVSVGQTATFNVVASGPGPLSYQWQKNGTNISGATSASYTTPATVLGDSGSQFRCVVTNASGSATSTAATLTVSSNLPPSPVINVPTSGARFSYGDVIQFSGSATDPESGTLSSGALTWRIDYFTGAAQRPGMPSTSGISSGSYSTTTASPYKGTDVYYRVYLTATDPGGLSTTVFRDLLPNVVNFSLDTNIPGLTLTLDGAAVPSGTNVAGVAGLERQLGAAAAQVVGGVSYGFVSWSDGGAATHQIVTPASSFSFQANYLARTSAETTLVNWAGNYVSSDTAFQRYTNNVESGLTLDGNGQANDARWTIPFSDTTPLNPHPNGGNAYGGTYTQGSSWRFYGGAQFESYNAPFSTRWGEVWSASPDGPNQDHIYAHASSTNEVNDWMLVYWKKADFLSGANGTVQFTSNTFLSVRGYLGADGLPSANSGWLRFVVRDGNQFYISQEIGQPSATAADFNLYDPNGRLWAPYDPASSLRFNAAGANWQFHYFTDVTSVGVYHSNDNSSSPGRKGGVNFAQFEVTGVVALPPTETPGFYDRTTSTWFLKNTAGQGVSDAVFPFGPVNPNWQPLVGDWNADGGDSVGFYDRTSSLWFLKNQNAQGVSDLVFAFGPAGTNWTPLTGDWNGDGTDGIGFFDPGSATWFLKNSLAQGLSDLTFPYGPANQAGKWIPLVGDWNGDGTDTVGFYDRSTSTWFLKNSLGQGVSDVVFKFGPTGTNWVPLVGDWDGDGADGVGFYVPATATWYLKNNLSQGLSDQVFSFGPARTDGAWLPLVGDWDGAGAGNLLLAAAALPPPAAEKSSPAAQAYLSAGAEPIEPLALARIVDAAIEAWELRGLSDADRLRLRQTNFGFADLPAGQLAITVGNQILLDVDASGLRWFADPTPEADEEFLAGIALSSAARDRIDLLTVVQHELGHRLGLVDRSAADQTAALPRQSVMTESLPVGIRRRP